MSQLQVIRAGAFRHDGGLKAEIADIVAMRFIDDSERLEKEFERRDTLYLLRGDSGDILCFFLVSWDSLDVNGRRISTLNTGLTAARPNRKGMGESLRLYRHVVAEAREWERTHQRKLVVWGTTATPIVYFIVRRIFTNLQPSEDGAYTEDSERVARAVRRRLGADERLESHPFAFHGLVSGVRFTEEERCRVASVCRTREFRLFDRLGIDEAEGDRLLFVAEVPPRP